MRTHIYIYTLVAHVHTHIHIHIYIYTRTQTYPTCKHTPMCVYVHCVLTGSVFSAVAQKDQYCEMLQVTDTAITQGHSYDTRTHYDTRTQLWHKDTAMTQGLTCSVQMNTGTWWRRCLWSCCWEHSRHPPRETPWRCSPEGDTAWQCSRWYCQVIANDTSTGSTRQTTIYTCTTMLHIYPL